MFQWNLILHKLFRLPPSHPMRRRNKGRTHPRLEELEDRITPADLTVTSLSGDPNVVGSLPFEVNAAQSGQPIGFTAGLRGPYH